MKFGLRYSQRLAGSISLTETGKFPTLEKGDSYPFEINVSVFKNFLGDFTKPQEIEGFAKFPGLDLWQDPTNACDAPPVFGQFSHSTQGVVCDFTINLGSNLELHCQGRPIEVRMNGAKIGTAQLDFRTPFWTLITSIRMSRWHGDTVKRQALTKRVANVARVFTIPPTVNSTKNGIATSELEQRLQLLIGQIPVWAVFATNATITALELFSVLFFGKTIAKISEAQADRYADFFYKYPTLRLLTKAVNVPIFLTVYSTPSYLAGINLSVPAPISEAEPERWMSLCFSPSRKWSQETLEIDAVVVGSGAGGGAAAYELASQGHAVAIVEEGGYFKRKDFVGDRVSAMGRYYRDSGYGFLLSNSPVWLPTGRCVGGTTTINAGTCFRLPARILAWWQKEKGLIDINLDSYNTEVEAMLDAKPVNASLHGPIKDIVEKGLAGTEYECEPLHRAETGCDGQGHCIIGCPTGAKRSTDVSYIPAAMKLGAHLFTHYKVEEILFDGDRAVGVRAQLPGYGPEFSIRILAKKVILAAGTLKTPNLLKRAGLHSRLPQLGRNLSIHPAVSVGASFDHNVNQKYFVPQSLAAFSPNHDKFVLEGYTMVPDAMPMALALFRKNLAELMNQTENFADFSAMLIDASHGRLLFFGRLGSIPMYLFDAEGIDRIKIGIRTLVEMFFKAGAKTVYAPALGYEKIEGSFDGELFSKTRFRARDFLTLSGHHPLGTCVMGTNASNSVVSSKGKVWGVENLYITDASVIPGPIGVNPQVTIMANALRIARAVGEDLKANS